MPARHKAIFFLCPFVPYPPTSGIELRVFRLLKWMNSTGYRVVLIMSAGDTDAEAIAELRKLTSALYSTKPPHWATPALRTRLGMRFPRLRRVLWEPIKPQLRKLRWEKGSEANDRFASSEVQKGELTERSSSRQSVGDDKIKAWFASKKLLRLVGRLSRKYNPQVVIVEYIFATPAFARVPAKALKIVDTIDVFSRKEDQVLAFGIADPLATSEAEERDYLLKADVVIAIQSREAELLRALVPEREVIHAGVDFDVVSHSCERESIPFRVAVVASDNPLNVHGLQTFLAECWPGIRESCPAASLQVVGRVGQLCRVEDSSINYCGWVADLDTVYREASVVINPTIAGTGLKIKSVEALAHAKPLVAWPHGVDGLEYEGQAPFIECRSWEEFRDSVVLLLTSDAERVALSKRALAYARAEFDASSVYAELRKRLGDPLSS